MFLRKHSLSPKRNVCRCFSMRFAPVHLADGFDDNGAGVATRGADRALSERCHSVKRKGGLRPDGSPAHSPASK